MAHMRQMQYVGKLQSSPPYHTGFLQGVQECKYNAFTGASLAGQTLVRVWPARLHRGIDTSSQVQLYNSMQESYGADLGP